MSICVIGQVVTSQGFVHTVDRFGDNPQYWQMPAVAYRRSQPANIGVHFDHDRSWRVGSATYLERSKADGLLAMAVLERDDLVDMLNDGPWFISDSVRSSRVSEFERSGGVLEELSLVRQTGNVSTRPVRWSFSDGAPAGLPLNWRDSWKRGHEHMTRTRYRVAPDHLTIHDLDRLSTIDELLTDPSAARRLLDSQRPIPMARSTTRDHDDGGKLLRRTFSGAGLHFVDSGAA